MRVALSPSAPRPSAAACWASTCSDILALLTWVENRMCGGYDRINKQKEGRVRLRRGERTCHVFGQIHP